MEIYLDNAATTCVCNEVQDVIMKTFYEDYGNPSSLHRIGLKAEDYIKKTNELIGKNMKIQPKEIVYTSGGTESNNLALLGGAYANCRAGKHIITTKIEHPSVLEPLGELEKQGFDISYLDVDEHGIVNIKQLEDTIRDETILVSIMYVNNEIGTVQDIEQMGKMIKDKNPKTLFHVDAIQAFGKYKICPKKFNVDMMSVSGHKIHGPKGTGFLFIRDKVKIKPLIYGGGQQRGLRSGTENVSGVAGLGKAIEVAYTNFDEKIAHLYQLKKQFVQGVYNIKDIHVNGIKNVEDVLRSVPIHTNILETAPHIVSVSFQGVKAEVLLHALEHKGIYVSSGSACASNHPAHSGTLKAIGMQPQLLDSTLRFSFSVQTTQDDIDAVIDILQKEVAMLRKFTRGGQY